MSPGCEKVKFFDRGKEANTYLKKSRRLGSQILTFLYFSSFVFKTSQKTFQRCFNVAVRLLWLHDVVQRQINVAYVNVEIFTVEQHRINVNLNVDINNVIQRWNNVAIFNVVFLNVDQRRNNVVNITIWKKLKRTKKYFWAEKETKKEKKEKKKKEKKR